MEFVRFTDATLGQLDERFYFAATCQSCQRHTRISIARLKESLPDTFLLKDLSAHLKCSTCGSRNPITAFFNPGQGNSIEMRELFAKKPV